MAVENHGAVEEEVFIDNVIVNLLSGELSQLYGGGFSACSRGVGRGVEEG